MSFQIEKVGVIGAGQMGGGIAHVCALAGYDVFLMDQNSAQVERALEKIARSMDKQVQRGQIASADKDAAVARIVGGTALSALSGCQIAIEAATENEDVKKSILKELCGVLPKDAIIATNTSSISITRLAAQTDRPGRVVGMHFMNPVPRMELIELIRGIATDEDTFAVAREMAVKLGKTPVSAEDFPAFIVNRILLPMINEAVYTLYEGVGNVDSIDTAMKLGTNHPMGPLELADFIGLDVCLAVMHVLHEGLADTKYRPCPLLVKYVEAGWLGRKSGRGFYDYSGDTPTPTR
ncbi:MAG: 3-hydroxybutyryl-CoA dehydrogenase [Rhodospirillales bacterium]